VDSKQKTSVDVLFGGSVVLEQPLDGYRFNIDSAILAAFLRQQITDGTVVDLGAGVGVLGISLATSDPDSGKIYCVEIQRELAELCRKNIERNGVDDRVVCLHEDIRNLREHFDARVQHMVSNPPYFLPGHGAQSPRSGKAAARHQIHGTIDDWLRHVRPMLAHGGSFHAVFPARFFPRIQTDFANHRLALEWLKPVYPRIGEPASSVLVRAVATESSREMELARPLYVREDGDAYSEEIRELLQLQTS
jgi:tRNA1Val (adenine37-N6)-methyltransferase